MGVSIATATRTGLAVRKTQFRIADRIFGEFRTAVDIGADVCLSLGRVS